MCGWGWGYGMSGWGPVGWTLIGLFWLALIGLIVWAVVRLVQGRAGGSRGQPPGETPEEILDRRYARGEIDTAAYEQARGRLAERSQR